MAGTNDVGPNYGEGITIDESMANLDAIVAASGASRVLVSAIAPSDVNPVDSLTFNTTLLEHATAMGWAFVDPWTFVRTADGEFIPGTTADGRHPTAEVQTKVGRTMAAAIFGAAA